MSKYCSFCDNKFKHLITIVIIDCYIKLNYICKYCYETLTRLYYTHCKVCGKKLFKHPNDFSQILSTNPSWILSEIDLFKFVIYYIQINFVNESLVLKYIKYLNNLKRLHVCTTCYKTYVQYVKNVMEFNNIQPYEDNINISCLYEKKLKSLLYICYSSIQQNYQSILPMKLNILRRSIINEIKEFNYKET